MAMTTVEFRNHVRRKQLERTEDKLRTSLWQKRKLQRSGSRPGQGVNNAARITYDEWQTLPVETLVRRQLLSMSLKQVKFRCTSNTVHFVLNEEHSKNALLNSNDVRQLLGEHHILYLLQNGWIQWILQEIVTFSAICSSKLLTESQAESIFSMQRINLSKPAYYNGSPNSFHIIWTCRHNTTRNIQTSRISQNPQDISGRRTLHYV